LIKHSRYLLNIRLVKRNDQQKATSNGSSELEVSVKNKNIVMAKMLEMDKYDKYQINPLYGSGVAVTERRLLVGCTPMPHDSFFHVSTLQAPEYYARGRRPLKRQKSSPPVSEKSPTEFWGQMFPLHKAAFEGDHLRVRELLSKGCNPDEQDNDFWSPLHYCAFYNRFEACEVLMTHPRTNVNAVNRTGCPL